MTYEIPTPLFKIGDEVETNEEYKQEIEESNRILECGMTSYKRGKLTHIQTVTDFKDGMVDGTVWYEYSRGIENMWICITLDDDPDKQVNQIYCRKVGE